MIAIILGTRPEIIKMSPVIRECEKEEIDVVMVEGDTNTVLAGVLAASKLHLKFGHVEAGLRSYDRNMPEEINRVLADHVSDYLFAPTEKAKGNLLREGIEEDKIFVTGNTIVDAVYQNLEIAKRKVDVLKKRNLSPKKYFLVTAHRQENVDNKKRLEGLLEGLELVQNEFNFPIIYPIHPRAEKRIKEFRLEVPNGVKLIEPLGFLDFLQLDATAKLVLTDSGGVQEEACILKVPCVTLRDNTERPETLEVGSNVLVGVNQDKILEGVKTMLNRERNWKNPFGDGKAGEKIIKVII
jgi:UDP-N-acetylglucosamine 2-epimerase (non-hydrolysing)